jgi:hypothetical protein
MSRKGPLLIAGIALVVICAGIWGLQAMKRQPKPSAASDASSTQVKRNPFRSAVVELKFRSRSLHDGEEYLSATGHRIEHIDVTGGRRREDYGRNVTVLRQSNSVETLMGIFDGADFYIVTEKEGKRTGRVVNMREGYDYTIWEDSAAEKWRVPGATVSKEEFLGRPCTVYSISPGTTVQKWWVWNGITLRSESHFEDRTTVMDTSEEAVRVEEDGDIDPGLFVLPADLTFEPAKPTVAEQLNHPKSAPWVRMGPEMNLFF